VSGFRELAEKYDGFIVDLWGVVHDGIKTYPGVVDCLARLKGAGKRVVFLSNAPRRAAAIGRALGYMGVGSELYDGIMSSGEAVFLALRDRDEAEFAGLGRKIFHLGPARDRDVFDTLDLIEVEDVAEADFLLNTGPDDYLGPDDPTIYEPVLNKALAAGVVMICANPDLEVVRDGKRIICAGILAQWFAERGGRVILRGKPDAAIYGPTLKLRGSSKERTLAVGDSLRTDIAGASAAGIDACWVLSGIDSADLAPEGVVAVLPGLVW
jgi:HAD superfamily hydrolase (TIGR01459 family)